MVYARSFLLMPNNESILELIGVMEDLNLLSTERAVKVTVWPEAEKALACLLDAAGQPYFTYTVAVPGPSLVKEKSDTDAWPNGTTWLLRATGAWLSEYQLLYMLREKKLPPGTMLKNKTKGWHQVNQAYEMQPVEAGQKEELG